ncbi:MAG: L,D-transpeptidase, partial [Deltaproteobacteria bacterium]|nr:L,D-transpeptidase [Deltaproteobacteria bacterium]
MPSNFLKWGKWGSDYAVLVDKSNQKVMLYKSDNLFEPEKVYQCSTGENGGPKNIINDKKTPEGIYYFINTYTRESLAPIYGSMALPLDYPNIFDVKEGRNGYG